MRYLSVLAVSVLSVVSLKMQAMSFVSPLKSNGDHKKVREAHAKELLGKHFEGSAIEMAQRKKDIYITIHNEIKEQLPPAYKKKSVQITRTIIKEGLRNNLDPIFLVAVIATESSFNPKAIGSVGEIGLMQIRPTTAKEVAKKAGIPYRGPKSLENPETNIRIGAAFFAQLRERFDGYANKYLSAYNIGAAKVQKLYNQNRRPYTYSVRVMTAYYEIYSSVLAEGVALGTVEK